jgi:hypothetical protein
LMTKIGSASAVQGSEIKVGKAPFHADPH